MLNKFITLFLVFFLYNSASAQKPYEYLGFLKIQDSLFITYRLKFQVAGDSIYGFSVSDYGGAHETKSYVSGIYNKKDKRVAFYEHGIEYTKSDVDTYDFCFVNFEGKLKNIDRQSLIEGNFSGKYKDGTGCINGEIMVKTIAKMYKKAAKVDKKIQRMKRIADSTKAKINLTKMLDEQRLNVLKKDETTTVFWDSDTIELVLWDAGKEDGDAVSMSYNNTRLLSKYVIEKQQKIIPLRLENGVNALVIKAENLGSIAPNTAKLLLRDGTREIDLLTNLNTLETTTISLIKQ